MEVIIAESMIKFLRNRCIDRLIYVIPLYIILMLLTGCKKEEEPGIKVLNLKTITEIYERDTIKIQYYVVKNNLDSVCLLIDDQIRQTQDPYENTIIFIPESRGSYGFQLKLNAYYKSGITESSEIYYVNVLTLYTPVLEYIISRDDGLSSYFVGEKISITIKARFDHESLDEFKQISVFLNDDNLGIKTAGPYTYISDDIIREQNQIIVMLTDINNRIHYVEHDLVVPVNTPPEIELEFNYRNNIPPGYFFTSDSIVTVLNGSDNVKIINVDYYVDDKLFTAKNFDIERLTFYRFGIGKLSAGTHNTYCIAFDDRGGSTKSGILSIKVYKDIDLNKEIRDVEYSDDEECVYILTSSILYVLNPMMEEVSKIIDLPFSDAISMDFSSFGNKLYIASQQGKLFTWSSTAQVLNEVPLPGISNIEDMEIDTEQNLALISNRKLVTVNLISGQIINTHTILDPGSTLIFDKVNKFIITGGNPTLSRGYIYIYQLGADTLVYKKKADIGGFGNRLQLNSNGNEFVISPKPRDLRTQINTYHAADLSLYSTIQQQYASVTTYSADGNYLFICDNWDSIVNVYKISDLLKTKYFPIPVEDHNYLNYLLPNQNNTCLVILTMNVFSSQVKIVFVRLN